VKLHWSDATGSFRFFRRAVKKAPVVSMYRSLPMAPETAVGDEIHLMPSRLSIAGILRERFTFVEA
jgi:hypothetical protein